MMGIYQIVNLENNKKYIGSSKNIFKRWESHVRDLQTKTHHSYLLQKDWNKYGEGKFSFQILENVSNEGDLKYIEQKYIDYDDFEDLYNVMSSTTYKSISLPNNFKENVFYSEEIPNDVKSKLKHNLNIYEKKNKMKLIGKEHFDLSKTWFNKNKESVDQLKRNIDNYFRNIMKKKSKEVAWTSYTQYYHRLSNKGNKKSFVPLNGELPFDNRRNTLCFAANCFPNSFIKRRYEDFSNLHDDTYALSILLKWVVSVSDIDKEINIYIPSKRMEEIILNWINKQNK